LNQLADLRRISGTNREMVVREAFKARVTTVSVRTVAITEAMRTAAR
jgi:hypothetical protein